MRPRLSIRALILAAALFAPPAAGQSEAPQDPALRPYLAANGLLARGMNELAAAEYRAFLREHAGHARAPVARYGLAVALFRMGSPEEASKELERIAGDRGFEFAPEARLMLGQCHLAAGRFADAGEWFARVVGEHGAHDLADDAAGLLVEAEYRRENYGAAEQGATELARRWPQSPHRARAEVFQGLSLLARGRPAEAADRFEAVLARSPGGELEARATLLLAQSRHRAGDRAAAARHYERVIEGDVAGLVPDALLGLASVHQEEGRSREAAPLLDRVLSGQGDGPLASEARLLRGRVLLDLEDHRRALADLEQVEKSGSGRADDAAYWIAKVHLRAGRPEESARRLAEAVEAFPRSRLRAEMLYDRAVSLVRAERPDEALAGVETFRREFPDHALGAEATQLGAGVAHQLGRFEESLALCREFMERFPGHAQTPAIEFLAAENLLLSGKDEEAAGAYERFLRRHADDAQAERAAFRLGSVLHGLDRAGEAKALLQRVVRGRDTPEAFRPALLLLGDIAFAEGDWAAAQARLQEFLAFGVEQASADDALLKLGLAQARAGEPGEAIESFDRLIEDLPDSGHRVQAMFERGQALVALDRPAEAAAAFEEMLGTGADTRFAPFAHNHLGVLAEARGDHDGAVAHFRKAGAGDAGLEGDALFREGLAHAGAGRHEEARAAFARLENEFASHSRAGEAAARRAIALSRLARPEEALRAIEQAPLRELAPALRDAVQYEKGWCLQALKRPDEAAGAYRALLEPGRDAGLRLYAMTELAALEAASGRHAEAAELLRTVRSEAPRAGVPGDLLRRATYQLGVSEFRLERFEPAAELMEEFIREAPQDPLLASASLVCGESLARLARHERATTHLRRVVEQFPDDPGRATALLRLGECQAALQRWADSERTFAEHLDRFSDSELWFQARFGLGWAHENQGRHDQAIAEYRRVAEGHQGPTGARAQFQIGECLFAQEKYEEAVRELLKVDILYAYPEWSAAALFEAGRCFEAMGRPEEARAQYAAVRERHGTTRWASMAAQRLEATRTRPVPGRQGG